MNQKFNRTRLLLVAFVLIAAIKVLSSCESYTFTPPALDPNQTWYLSTDIQPIFNSSCVSCHGGTKAPDLREGKSYSALTKGGYVNLPGETSRLYLKMTGADHTPRSTDAEKQKVLYWINQGAKNN
jgi:hypothetical protein